MNEERTPGESEWDVGSEVGGVLCGLQIQDTHLRKCFKYKNHLLQMNRVGDFGSFLANE